LCYVMVPCEQVCCLARSSISDRIVVRWQTLDRGKTDMHACRATVRAVSPRALSTWR